MTIAIDIRVQEADFSQADEYQALRARQGGAMGAVTAFVGLVRDQGVAGAVTSLVLEHYPGMTERSIEAIVRQAEARWPILDVVVIHRVGTLAATAQIVFVQVASGHRAAAFAACEFIMDYLKTDAVFWKREAGAAGAHWIEATGDDRARVEAWSDACQAGEPQPGCPNAPRD